MPITYEDTFQTPPATVVVTQVELAEAFLDQRNEGQAPFQFDEYEETRRWVRGHPSKRGPIYQGQAWSKEVWTTTDPVNSLVSRAMLEQHISCHRIDILLRLRRRSIPLSRRIMQLYSMLEEQSNMELDSLQQSICRRIIEVIMQPRESQRMLSYRLEQAWVRVLSITPWEHQIGNISLVERWITQIQLFESLEEQRSSLEIYHEDLSRQERQVWNHSIIDAQQFSED